MPDYQKEQQRQLQQQQQMQQQQMQQPQHTEQWESDKAKQRRRHLMELFQAMPVNEKRAVAAEITRRLSEM